MRKWVRRILGLPDPWKCRQCERGEDGWRWPSDASATICNQCVAWAKIRSEERRARVAHLAALVGGSDRFLTTYRENSHLGSAAVQAWELAEEIYRIEMEGAALEVKRWIDHINARPRG